MAVIITNVHKNFGTSLILSIENMSGNKEFYFQDKNIFCCRAKSIDCFVQEKHISFMTCPANIPSLNLMMEIGKGVLQHSSILQSWSVDLYSRKLETAWWRILFCFIEFLASKNSDCHKSWRKNNKILIFWRRNKKNTDF